MKNRSLHYMILFLKLWWTKSLPPRSHVSRLTWRRIYKHDPVRDGLVGWTILALATVLFLALLGSLGLDSLGLTTFTQSKAWYILLIAFLGITLLGGAVFNRALMEVSAFLKDVEEACRDLNMSIKEFSDTLNNELRAKAYSAMQVAAKNLEDSVTESSEIILGNYMTGNHMHSVFVGLGLLD